MFCVAPLRLICIRITRYATCKDTHVTADNGDYFSMPNVMWGTIDVNVTIADTGEVVPFTVDPRQRGARAGTLGSNQHKVSASSGTASCAAGSELAEMAAMTETASSKQPTGLTPTCRRRLALPGPLIVRHSVMYQSRAGSQPKLPGPHPHLESWTSGLTKTGSRSSRLWRPQVKLTHSITSVR